MEYNMEYLVKRRLHDIKYAIKKLKKQKKVPEKVEVERDVRKRILRIEDVPKKIDTCSSEEKEQIAIERESVEPMHKVCEEDGMIYCNNELILANIPLEDEDYCMKALQNLKIQGKVEIVYEAYDVNGREVESTISLRKVDESENFDGLKILKEKERVKEYGGNCILLDASWYRYFIKNFDQEDELYYRRALQNLCIDEYYKILDEAYDTHGRRCYDKLSLHKKNLKDVIRIYEIDDEVKRLKKFGLYAKLITKEEARYVVTNFSSDEESVYRKALQNLGIQGDFEIVYDAYDVHGRRIENCMSLRRLDPNNNLSFTEINKEINRIAKELVS